MRRALFAGSFDPVTIAHLDILQRGKGLFDEIIVGIGTNTAKSSLLSVQKRTELLLACTATMPGVAVKAYTGLTINFCRETGANYLLRGVRTAADFEYERAIAQVNGQMAPDIETIILLSRPEYSGISSTIVRDILRNGGPAEMFMPADAAKLVAGIK